MDVAVLDGKIARVEKNIPAGEEKKTVDVSGYYVTPGLIDIHVHVFHTSPTSQLSVIADHHHFSSGVTTCVDAGTSGAESFLEFKKVIDNSTVRILAFLNIASTGMGGGGGGEQNPDNFDVELAVETAKKHPDIIVGFKSAHYSGGNYDGNRRPWSSVDSALAAGRLSNLPVMFCFPPRLAEKGYPARSHRELILEKMRPGDILTHCFATRVPFIKPVKNGKVNPDFIKARKRGIIFDIGYGQGGIVFRNAVPAIKQGFIPNSISTDIHYANVNGPVINMVNIMSKFLCMGISFKDVIRLSTVNPAREINHTELGTLSVGSVADIAVLELIHGKFTYRDIRYKFDGGKIRGDKKLQCAMTLFGGEIVFDPFALGSLYWENIPEDDYYWVHPYGIDW